MKLNHEYQVVICLHSIVLKRLCFDKIASMALIHNTQLFVLHPQEVLKNIVKRYVAARIRNAKTEEGLTEENFKVSSFIFFFFLQFSIAATCLLFHNR